MNQWWSWVLMSVGVTSLYLAGRRSVWGWALGVFAQALWLTYSISTRQWGFLASCFAYGSVYVVNFRRWRSDARTCKTEDERKIGMEKGTATVTMTVSINGAVDKTFTSSAETNGDPRRLARRLAQTVSGDAQVWAIEQDFGPGTGEQPADPELAVDELLNAIHTTR